MRRFEDALERYRKRRLTGKEAGELLGMSGRRFRHLVVHYDEEGPRGCAICGSHYFHTPQAGGKVDKSKPTQVGRALAQLGITHIPSYSPEARGRMERVFGTLQGGCRTSELCRRVRCRARPTELSPDSG